MSIKARAYPTGEQVGGLWRNIHDARVVYNTGLDHRRYAWAKARDQVSRQDQEYQLVEARQENPWLAEGSSSVQQQALRDLDQAFKNFFANLKAGRKPGFPKHKKRDPNSGAFAVRDLSLQRLNRAWGQVHIPKVGKLRFRITRDWVDYTKATSARVKLANGRWHISFTTPPPQKKTPASPAIIGIDRGAKVTLADSAGGMHQMPGLTIAETDRYLRLERRLSRQKKGSKNRRKTLAAMAVIRRKAGDRRKDFTEKITTRLAESNAGIVLEQLPTRSMIKRPAPKEDTDQPGAYLPNGAIAKSKLAKLIHASWWGTIATRFEHKTEVMYVPAGYTSQRCHECGHTAKENRDSQADFFCTRCHYECNADINAARNIVDSGMGIEKNSWQCTAAKDHKPCPTRGQTTAEPSHPTSGSSGDRPQKTTPCGSGNLQAA